MGLFDFVKNAGEKVGLGKAKEAAAEAASKAAEVASDNAARAKALKAKIAARAAGAEAAADKQAAIDAAAAKRESIMESKKSEALEKYVLGLGLDAKGLDIRFDDGTAVIKGEVANQATLEKIVLAVGNSVGVETVDESMTVAEPAPASTFHVVEKGDTLSKIAKEVYGDAMRYPEIFEANKPMLKSADLIYPGQVLRIPADG